MRLAVIAMRERQPRACLLLLYLQVKRLGRALHEVEEERDAMRSASEAAKEAADAAMQVKNDLEAALEAANRQRDQSLNAAAAARDVEMAATSRAREVEMAAADALKRADKVIFSPMLRCARGVIRGVPSIAVSMPLESPHADMQAEAQAAIATASTKAAELRAETARRSLQAKQLELETLQAQHEEVLESSQVRSVCLNTVPWMVCGWERPPTCWICCRLC